MPVTDRAVLDASAVLRAVVDEADEAGTWIDRLDRGTIDGLVPDLLYAEVANALVNLRRAAILSDAQGAETLEKVARIPLSSVSSRDTAVAVYALALSRNVTAYDAHYLALAEAEDAVLVTADGALAAAATRSVLLE